MLLRETLTFLSTLLLALLLAALVGPYFVDWRDWRPAVETRLSNIAGVPVTVAGEIRLRFLPTPRLNLGDVSVGSPSAATPASFANIERLDLELAPGDLLRGKVRFSDAAAEGATIVASTDGKGGILLPHVEYLADKGLAFERLRIGRSEIRLKSPDGKISVVGPVALEASAPQLAGPWRIEGEVAGRSLRLVTGESETGGRTRARLNLGSDQGRLTLDGYILGILQGGLLKPGFDGTLVATFNMGSAPAEPATVAATFNGKLVFGNQVASLSELNFMTGEGAAGRIEGEARLDLNNTGPSSLTLRSRRLAPASFAEPLRQIMTDVSETWRRSGILLPDIALSADIEQLLVLGEETGEASLRGWLGQGGLTRARFGTSLAGARIGFDGTIASPESASGAVSVSAPDTRRLALALNRMGLDAALADAVSGLGSVELQARGQIIGPGNAVLDQAIAKSPTLRLDASGRRDDRQLALSLKLDGLTVSQLPPLTALASMPLLAGDQEIRLDLAFSRLRLGQDSVGEAQLEISRRSGNWIPGRFSANGFGGLVLKGAGEGQGNSISGSLDAPQADAVLGLAGPFLPEALRSRLFGAVSSLSPVALRYDLTRKGDRVLSVKANGSAGRASLDWSSNMAAGDQPPEIEVRVGLPERALFFQGLGVPRPAVDGPVQVLFRQTGRNASVSASLSGDGLSISAVGNLQSGFELQAMGDRAGLLLPDAFAQMMPAGSVSARGKLAISATETRLDALRLEAGAMRADGHLTMTAAGTVTGALAVPALSLPDMLGLALQPAPNPSATAFWNPARFGQPVALPMARVALQAPMLRTGAFSLTDASLDLGISTQGLSLDNIRGQIGEGTGRGNLAVRRDGGLASLSGHLAFDRIDVGRLTGGELKGRATGRVEFGGSGESPARLVASLGGTGELQLDEASITSLDPAALARVVGATDDSAAESDRTRLGQRLRPALAGASWQAGTVPVQLTLSGGVIRLTTVSLTAGESKGEFGGLIDLRSPALDLRANVTMLGARPKGWSGPMPQLAVSWRGPLDSPRRDIDPAALSNSLAARALAREIERVEAFEADIRERSFFARRLKAERDMREAEAREAEAAREAARLAEIQRILDESKRLEDERIALRNQQPPVSPVAPLPPPLDIRSVPLPLSRP